MAYANAEHYWDWDKAEQEFKIGLKLSPNYATGHQWYGEFLLKMRRFDEAMKEIKIARELDPLSMIIHLVEAWGYVISGNYVKGVEVIQYAVNFYPDSRLAHSNKFYYNRLAGNDEESFKALLSVLKINQISDEDIGNLRKVYKTDGWRGIDLLQLKHDLEDGASPTDIAADYIILEDYEKAIDWLEKAYDERDHYLSYLNSNPSFRKQELVQNKRFQVLFKKMNYPE